MGPVRTLITGASSGLGEGMAREFAARGHELALVARRTDRLEALAAELAARPGSAQVVTAQLDVTDDEAVARVVPEVAGKLGGLDRMIVNAGIGDGRKVGSGRPEANLRTARTNFVAAIAQAEAAMEIFRAQGSGHLVLVTSVAADRGLRGAQTVYAAAKAGLSTFAEGLRSDVHGTGIAVTELAPGYIRTDLNEGMSMPFGVDTSTGVRAMVDAIERRPGHAYAPRWPWSLLGPALRVMPMPLVRALT
ncbi:SDR family oxidoreductase [Actinomycetospora chiangmaiensis]|uniref:SDR family oxidoreductase n=1 Tax=Actinomycetospora chiangmaiensis TaxID=402650 RepID=UPI00037FAA35